MGQILRKSDGFNIPRKLFSSITGMMRDNARDRVARMALTAMVDNSTGVSAGTTPVGAFPLPALFTSSAADKAPKAGLDTALGKVNASVIVIAAYLNTVRAVMGLPLLVYTGAPALAGTIPAMDKTVVATNGAGGLAAPFATALASMKKASEDFTTLIDAANEVLGAMGAVKIIDNTNALNLALALQTVAATGAGVTGEVGAPTISKASADAFLTKSADVTATLAARINAGLDLTTFPPLEALYID